ncbi:putative NUP-1 protein [Trypanosoma cruzi]|nr:putative NUP-1 protein [Trypanosoma cruzi]
MRKVEEVNAELMKAQRDYRALERLMRSSGRLSTSRVENNDGEEHEREMSFTPTFLRNTEGAELAQFLQISSLQADLMLSRSTCHRLEARQLELQTALEQSEWRLTSLPPGVEESHAELLRVRGQLENNQLEYHRLEGRYKALKRQRAEEVEQLQRQNERLVQQLRRSGTRSASLSRQMRDSEVAAKQRRRSSRRRLIYWRRRCRRCGRRSRVASRAAGRRDARGDARAWRRRRRRAKCCAAASRFWSTR